MKPPKIHLRRKKTPALFDNPAWTVCGRLSYHCIPYVTSRRANATCKNCLRRPKR